MLVNKEKHMNFLIALLIKLATSKAAETAIGYGINKLLEHKTEGIGNELAKTMINGIAKSKANPTTEDMFKDALNGLGA
jgi:hypothetical protein